MNLWQQLLQLDHTLFTAINFYGHHEKLNGLMLLLRNPYTWIPLYLFLLYRVYREQPSLVLPFFLASLCCFAITDYSSASLLKPFIHRLRPCHNVLLSKKIFVLLDCGGKYSFPSSHASNHFGLAMAWFGMFNGVLKKKYFWLWIWAGSICYAQIYVGKHFPMDILAGAMLGLIVGKFISWIFLQWFRNKQFAISTNNTHGAL